MKASKFDRKLDEGENILEDLELTRARRPGWETKQINVDVPIWMVEALDREARRVGVTR